MAWEGAAARGIAACLVSFGFAAGVRADHCPVLLELGGPLISGTTAYVSGTHVWTDYAYDDRGENTNAIKRYGLDLDPNPLFADGCESRTGARREITTDGASDVTLSGLLPGTQVSLDGAPLGAVGASGSFTAPVPAGAHTVLLRP